MLKIQSSKDLHKSAVLRTLVTGVLAVLSAAALVACQPAVPAAHAEPAASAIPDVPVALVTQTALSHSPAQVARVEATRRVDLQARIAGPIDAVLFREGDVVQAGQALFQIDPRPFDAAVARARADVQLAQARESLAASEADRATSLRVDSAIAEEEVERRAAGLAEAQARRAAAEAALRTAQLDREFTLVRAPMTGRIGRALVTAGNFVVAGTNATPLASIVSTASLDVHFDVSDRHVIDRLAGDRAMKGWSARILDVDGQHELAQAPVDFADHSIDAGTGTLHLRARVQAPKPGLMPGQYVRVQLTTGQVEPVLMVPDKAIGTDQGQRFVLVVGEKGLVEYRAVSVGVSNAQNRIVTAGLKAGEKVIVSGLMRVRPGMTVKPQWATEPAQAQAAAAKQS
jgi:RND family efflux transporter MFP subunit